MPTLFRLPSNRETPDSRAVLFREQKDGKMNRNTKFSARFSPEDQALLVHVAARMRRTKSDAVRLLIYEKAAEFGLLSDKASFHSWNQKEGE